MCFPCVLSVYACTRMYACVCIFFLCVRGNICMCVWVGVRYSVAVGCHIGSTCANVYVSGGAGSLASTTTEASRAVLAAAQEYGLNYNLTFNHSNCALLVFSSCRSLWPY